MATRQSTITNYCRVMSVLKDRLDGSTEIDRSAFTKEHGVTANFFNMLHRAGYIDRSGPVMNWTGPEWPERKDGEAVAQAEVDIRAEAKLRRQQATPAPVPDEPTVAEKLDALRDTQREIQRALGKLTMRVVALENDKGTGQRSLIGPLGGRPQA